MFRVKVYAESGMPIRKGVGMFPWRKRGASTTPTSGRTSSNERSRSYRAGLVPVIVPITLLNHYVRRFEEPYLSEQVYQHPRPLELKLRNHV